MLNSLLRLILHFYKKENLIELDANNSTIYDLFKKIEEVTLVPVSEQDLVYNGGYLKPNKHIKLKTLFDFDKDQIPRIFLKERHAPSVENVLRTKEYKNIEAKEQFPDEETKFHDGLDNETREVDDPFIKDLIEQGQNLEQQIIALNIPYYAALNANEIREIPSTLTKRQLLQLSDESTKMMLSWDSVEIKEDTVLRKIRQDNIRKLLNMAENVDKLALEIDQLNLE